jgi:uncharacterized membrane protein YozB (DUF420 family)
VLSAALIILILKVAVVAVTLLLIASLIALARGRYRLHGRINIVFFTLTLIALVGLEVVARLIEPDLFTEYFTKTDTWTELYIHLCFSIPSALLLPILLYSGLRGRIKLHFPLALVFLVFWTGTLITGVFFLPYMP